MTIREIDVLRKKVQATCDLLIKEIGPIQIGSTKIFPYGWRKSAKGRTVWRIVEDSVAKRLDRRLGFGRAGLA